VTRYGIRYALINLLHGINMSKSLYPTCWPLFGQPYIIVIFLALCLRSAACTLTNVFS